MITLVFTVLSALYDKGKRFQDHTGRFVFRATVIGLISFTLGTVTFAYEDVGLYAINSSNLFTNNKTVVFIGNNTNNSGEPISIYTSWNDASYISLLTFNIQLADWKNDSIIKMPILIEVYP